MGGVQRHEGIGIAHRCAMQNEPVDHGEDGGVGSDAQSDGNTAVAAKPGYFASRRDA